MTVVQRTDTRHLEDTKVFIFFAVFSQQRVWSPFSQGDQNQYVLITYYLESTVLGMWDVRGESTVDWPSFVSSSDLGLSHGAAT